MSERPIDRNLLASFIEYAAKGAVTPSEWDRFAVNHYLDPAMEQARVECVRIFRQTAAPESLSAVQRNALYELAKGLRE